MKKRTIILAVILGMTIGFMVSSVSVKAQENTQGAFSTSKTDRSLIKDLVVGQREIKSKLSSLESKIGGLGVCK